MESQLGASCIAPLPQRASSKRDASASSRETQPEKHPKANARTALYRGVALPVERLADDDARVVHERELDITQTQTDDWLRTGNSSGGPPSSVWTDEEDEELFRLVTAYGPSRWSSVCRLLNQKVHGDREVRTARQCRERWSNHLDPTKRKGGWSADEDDLILEKQAQLGNRWSEIAKLLTGRTEHQVKNRFNSLMRRARRSILGSTPLTDRSFSMLAPTATSPAHRDEVARGPSTSATSLDPVTYRPPATSPPCVHVMMSRPPYPHPFPHGHMVYYPPSQRQQIATYGHHPRIDTSGRNAYPPHLDGVHRPQSPVFPALHKDVLGKGDGRPGERGGKVIAVEESGDDRSVTLASGGGSKMGDRGSSEEGATADSSDDSRPLERLSKRSRSTATSAAASAQTAAAATVDGGESKRPRYTVEIGSADEALGLVYLMSIMRYDAARKAMRDKKGSSAEASCDS
ncbi:unnamed protein product [Vitrella brassicaformis CCMP3155]|uniref:Uncharacterized protein n=2 Tax=Vitrella brassicaformis TaxID=1169539 RepID=A0A0G4F7M3_VITBC|nr:unnamed protein product [Vitrella brassicaformis CCMP3155]|eukprot:CEM08006.1 unnamed protein product [Vitrella brassicaformis CCMP3155]